MRRRTRAGRSSTSPAAAESTLFAELGRHQTHDLRHAPRLRDTSTGAVRRFAVEDLRELAESPLPKELEQRRDRTARLGGRRGRAAVDPEIRAHVRTDQPRPNRSLVIRTVARPRVTGIKRNVTGIARGEGSQTV